jgi:hypothetical protein
MMEEQSFFLKTSNEKPHNLFGSGALHYVKRKTSRTFSDNK